MKLEQQVVSLELAKKLKELGVKQESLYWYTSLYPTDAPIKAIISTNQKENLVLSFGKQYCIEDYSAFSVAELGEMLPQGFYSIRDDGKMAGTPPLHACWYNHKMEIGTTEADARAKMLIHLIEQGLITPKE